MKKWLQLLASLSANKFLWDVASFIHKFACQNFDQMGTGGIGLLQVVRSWSVTKSLTNQKAELQKFISENFVVSRTKETSSYIFTPATPLVAPKMINFAPKRNATYMSGTPFPTLISFLLLLPESVRLTYDVRWRHDHIFWHRQVPICYG